jgi:hypothetical protein
LLLLAFRPRFVGGQGTEGDRGAYRDACSIARSEARTIGRVFDTPPSPPEGRLTGSAQPADPVPPVEPPPGGGRDRALLQDAKVGRHAT